MEKVFNTLQRILPWYVLALPLKNLATNKKKRNERLRLCLGLSFISIFILFCCTACNTTRGLYFDLNGNERVRESFGELKEREQAIDDEERRLKELSTEIEGGIGEEDRIIRQLEELLRRIRERRKDGNE